MKADDEDFGVNYKRKRSHSDFDKDIQRHKLSGYKQRGRARILSYEAILEDTAEDTDLELCGVDKDSENPQSPTTQGVSESDATS